MMNFLRILFTITLAAVASSGAGSEPQFSLKISAGSTQSLSPVQEAQQALWNDPMLRLMRAMDAEIGHLLIGQPGGRTPPVISVGVGGGLPPRILSAAFESNLTPISEPPTAVIWPWLKEKDPAAPPMETQLAQLLGERLERRLGSGDEKLPDD